MKFRAQSVDFLEVSNPRALLEVALRKFTCLTVGDTICIPHSGKKFYLDVREVEPNGAASIIETDCNVDFEEPLGYKDSKYAQFEKDHKERQEAKQRAASFDSTGGAGAGASSTEGGAVRTLQKARAEPTAEEAAKANAFKAVTGSARRIDGKLTASAQEAKMTGSGDGGAAVASAGNAAGIAALARAEAKSDATSNSSSVPVYQSRIGDKYSKKKTAVSAFTGTAHKLN